MTEENRPADLDAKLFQILLSIDRRARKRKDAIPATVLKQENWQGLAFTLDGVRVVSAMNEIRELLPYPSSVTPVPGSRDWMLGLANIRGELLPIIDLQRFIGASPVPVSDQARVLVIRSLGTSTGLLVGSVQGMRHLPADKRIPDAEFEGALGRYVYDVFGLEDGVWPVFSMAGLVRDNRFMSAAA